MTTLPAPAPAPPPRLLCDEMLAALARWLRASGHDTALAPPGASDGRLLAQCRSEDRVLITRDQALARSAPPVRVVLLASDDLDQQAAALTGALGLDWDLAPFTRCMTDNTPLNPATPEEIARMPETSRRLPGPFRACPCCGRLYWPGSHVRRMAERLRAWAKTEQG